MKNLLNKLIDNNILLELIDGELKVFSKEASISPSLLSEIRENKDRLVSFLSGNDQTTYHTSSGINIPVVTQRAGYPLSSSQKRLWLLSQFEKGNIAYNMPGAYLFEGPLDKDALIYSFDALIDRHEILRTIFRKDENGEPIQFIISPEEFIFNMSIRDLRDSEDQNGQLKKLMEQHLSDPFDLSAGPLVRAVLFRLADEKWLFIYCLHHIISDSWSMGILINELFLLYNAQTQGRKADLPPLRIQYKDYATWQQKQLSEEGFQIHKIWWMNELSGELPVLEFPADKPRPAKRTYEGAVIRQSISKESVRGLQTICQLEGCTLFMGLLAATNVILYKYSGQKDIIVGCPIAAREYPELEAQIGFYTNTLAVRTKFEGKDSFRELLKAVQKTTLNAYEHQAYPFDELVDALNIRSAAGRHPLFDVLIELRNNPLGKKESLTGLSDIRISPFEDRLHTVSKFDLTFFFLESDSEMDLVIEYNSDIYNSDTIAELGSHFSTLMDSIGKNPDTSVSRLECIDPEERNKLLFEFNNTTVAYAGDRTVVDLFETQAANTPDKIALKFGETEVSYQELNDSANRLANHLQTAYHIKPDDRIGIMMDRSEKMIIAITAILKAGAAYVPIDPEYPEDRKVLIINDSGIKALITQMDYTYDLTYSDVAVFAIDIQLDILETSSHLSCRAAAPGNLAYLIYTSGTTGVPKGCMMTHANLYNYISWANSHYFGETDESNFGLYTSLAFDLTVTSIFCSLTRGSKLTIYGQQQDLLNVLTHSFSPSTGVNSIKLTPSFIAVLQQLDITGSSISRIIVGGEEVTPLHVKILKSIDPAVTVYNEYGPTETTVGCMVASLEEHVPVTIGRPISNTEIYVLDESCTLCPIGVPGEIYVGGAGVAKGYLNNEGLTKGKFIDNPFKRGERIYRTGDWGKWTADGNAVFLGRKDEQVKIRGYRIELGEITSLLLRHPGVRQAVTLTKNDGEGNKDLVVYYVRRDEDGGTAEPGDLQQILVEWLKKQLPPYMIPLRFIQLDGIPLTTNGKIDNRRLLEMENPEAGDHTLYIAPGNEIEERLVAIWKEVLNNERIGMKDDFFDLGGNSIKAMRLIARINKEFDIDLGIDRLFKNPTVGEVAAEIENTNWANTGFAETDNVNNAEKFSI